MGMFTSGMNLQTLTVLLPAFSVSQAVSVSVSRTCREREGETDRGIGSRRETAIYTALTLPTVLVSRLVVYLIARDIRQVEGSSD